MKKNINKNCWLVRNINDSPAERCKYCQLRFHSCLFFQYIIISFGLTILFITISYFLKGEISKLLVIALFTLIIVYGYFFNKSTNSIIKANFAQKEARKALEELSKNLQRKVAEQTKELKAAYQVEKKAKEELEKLNEAKSQFMLATQHHLRTPLTSMQGYIDLLLTGTFGKVSKKVEEALKKLEKSTKNEIKVVEELLSISQFQLGEKVVTLSADVKIEDILEEVVEHTKSEVEKKGIFLRVKKPEKIPRIKGDEAKLRVALTNIVDNAVKYTQEGGITIKLEPEKNKLKIIIKDTGIGIDKKEISNLFSRTFERSKKAQKLFATGRGIGLYISAKIIEAHKGKIWAESEGKSKGSTFYIELVF